MMKKLSLNKLNAFFEAVSAKEKLYLPVDNAAGQAQFMPWQSGVEMSRALNTTRSAKDFFFPQTEALMEFKLEGKTIQIIDNRKEEEDFVIFGARACDVRSFSILDKVFLAEPVDTFYANRRKHGVIVSVACTRPTETCFCGAFGIDMTAPEGDVAVWMTESDIYFKAQSEKGEALLASVAELLDDADEAAVEAQKADVKAIAEKLPLKNLPLKAIASGEMLDFFNSPKWASLSESCLGCGTCTFVCPTCQCYDIMDFNTGHGIIRQRCWDSCMYSDFTKMSAGQPRPTQLERFRQRFMHKLVYFPSNNNGEFGCVGCGRCLAKCPISMNIVKVMKALGGETK